jgi:Domain of unknown function (DUF4391)
VTAADLVTALNLPASALVGQRVPKKLLLENGAPTAVDKRYLSEGVEELFWVAALKATTIGVPEYRDEVREYLEIAVIRLTLRPAAESTRLIELVHRAIPYPLLLISEMSGVLDVSAAHIRWSQGEAGKTVLDGDIVTVRVDGEGKGAFLEAMSLGRQSPVSLHALYKGWIDTLLSLQAARVTGNFAIPVSPSHAAARRDALRECERLEGEITRLRAAATKERQLAKQVDLNLELKRLQADYIAARTKL